MAIDFKHIFHYHAYSPPQAVKVEKGGIFIVVWSFWGLNQRGFEIIKETRNHRLNASSVFQVNDV